MSNVLNSFFCGMIFNYLIICKMWIDVASSKHHKSTNELFRYENNSHELLNIFFSKGFLFFFFILKLNFFLNYFWQFLNKLPWTLNRLASILAEENFVTWLCLLPSNTSSLGVNHWVRLQNVHQKSHIISLLDLDHKLRTRVFPHGPCTSGLFHKIGKNSRL